MLLPAIHGNNNTKIYYDIAKSMPSTLPSNVATDKLKEDFDMSTMHMIMMDSNMDSKDKRDMLDAIDNVKGKVDDQHEFTCWSNCPGINDSKGYKEYAAKWRS